MSEAFYVNLDLTEVQPWDGQSSMVEPGTYVFEVVDAEQSMSSGNEPQIKVNLKVVQVLAVGDGVDDQHGRTMNNWYSLKQDRWQMARLKNFLQAVGAPTNGFGRDDLIGRQFQGVVQRQTLPARPLPNGQPGEPKVLTKVIGESALAPVQAPAPAPAAGRRVVGAATGARNGQQPVGR